jgi:hypothetical protein
MKTHPSEPNGAHAMATPDNRDEMSFRGCLGWLTAITPRGRAQEEVEWRFVEAERLESLNVELRGY